MPPGWTEIDRSTRWGHLRRVDQFGALGAPQPERPNPEEELLPRVWAKQF